MRLKDIIGLLVLLNMVLIAGGCYLYHVVDLTGFARMDWRYFFLPNVITLWLIVIRQAYVANH